LGVIKKEMEELNKKVPLKEYPWHDDAVRIIKWTKSKPPEYRAFIFDICMSLAFIDSTSGIEKYVETCPSCPESYNAHLGFINLCSPCYEKNETWTYQKAAKPQSGALGKLSSEMILKFIEILFDDFKCVFAIGGTEIADALIEHKNGFVILAEVKSAPLITFPLLFQIPKTTNLAHSKISLTSSQFRELNSAIYLHDKSYIHLGKVKSENWPFKPFADHLEDKSNLKELESSFKIWQKTKVAYAEKDRTSKFYYLANASGAPPNVAKEKDGWPQGESISDSKTSAGMDRTDDIKKGIYQVLKIGTKYKHQNVKTAIISNLPALRHGEVYVDPFKGMLWGNEGDLVTDKSLTYLKREDLRYVFDYIINLTDSIQGGKEI
ncbi:MAG: hypothetical protein WCN88_05525, partial [Candidatus Falkowbacteria bacterium]